MSARFHANRHIGYVAIIFLLLTGCQSLPRQSTIPDAAWQQSLLAEQTNWRSKGKLSVVYEARANSAQFTWSQQSDDYQIHLFGPFGQGSTWLRKSGALVSLESTEIENQVAASAEQLMEINFGWQVPVSNLLYWMRALPAPQQPISAEQRDEHGYLSNLHQQGWTISYKQYQHFDRWWLPAKLIARRGQLKVVIVIKHWDIQADLPATSETTE